MAKTIVYVIGSEKYFEGVINILRKESENSVIYVTTNKPYDHLSAILEKNNVKTSQIYFIDCISKHIGGGKKDTDNCIFVDSPHSLTDLVIAIGISVKAIEQYPSNKTLILDSLSTLLIYNDANVVGQFSNFVINKMRQYDVDTIILALDSDMQKDIIRNIQSFADEVRKYT